VHAGGGGLQLELPEPSSLISSLFGPPHGGLFLLATPGRAYDYDRTELADAIEKILGAAQFEFEDKNSLWQALAGFRQSGADFADCLISAKNIGAGCASTLTFDKRAGGLRQFSLS
jgi:predicted nucleic-acid-binding protein